MIFRQNPSPAYINVRKRKFDNSIKSEWEGHLLPSPSSDWLLVLHHPDHHLKFSEDGVIQANLLFLHFCNLIHPLTVLFEYSLDGHFRGAKCDAALPATRIGNLIEFVDLDLDLIVESNFNYSVRDEMVFAENRQKMDYPEAVVQQARKGMELAELLAISRQFPFDEDRVPSLKMTWKL